MKGLKTLFFEYNEISLLIKTLLLNNAGYNNLEPDTIYLICNIENYFNLQDYFDLDIIRNIKIKQELTALKEKTIGFDSIAITF